MKNRSFLGIFLLSIFLFSIMSVSAADVTDCQSIVSPGVYTVTQDIIPSGGACIYISADDVVLDFDGHTIINETFNSVAVKLSSTQDNITIKNIKEVKFNSSNSATYIFDITSSSTNIVVDNVTINGSYSIVRDRGIGSMTIKNSNFLGEYGSLALHYASAYSENVTYFNNTFECGIGDRALYPFAGSNNWNISNNVIITEDTAYNFLQLRLTNDNMNIENNVIRDNSNTGVATSIFISNSGGNFTNSLIKNNKVTDAGIGRFYFVSASGITENVTFDGNNFTNMSTELALYVQYNAKNITIKNNIFDNVNASDSYIVVKVNSDTINITNNTFTHLYSENPYILLGSGSNNSEVSFNKFIDNTDLTVTPTNIYLNNSDYVNIFNNTWNNSGAYFSIQINGESSDYVNTYNNDISCLNLVGSHGIIYRGSAFGKAYNNIISNCDFGFLNHNGSRSNIAYDNYIYNSTIAVYIIDDAVNNTLSNFTIVNTSTGISFFRYNDRGNLAPANNTINGFNIIDAYSTDIRGINISSERGSNNINNTIGANSNALINLVLNSTSLILTNVTSSSSTETVDANSSFIRKWYLDASADFDGANITLSNETATLYSALSSNFETQIITAYTNVGGVVTNVISTIAATYESYTPQSEDFTPADNKNKVFTFTIPASTGGGSLGSSCSPVWDCSGWTLCNGGIQIRSCSKLNSCSSNSNKPETEKTCSVIGGIIDRIGSPIIDPIIRRKNCGTKPEVGDWGACNSQDVTNRIDYECTLETDYEWLSYTDEKSCLEAEGFFSSVGSFFSKIWDWIIFWN